MANLEQILRRLELKNCKLVAGHNGIKREVNYATVMEVPEVVKWIKEDSFLITSLYALKDNIEKQCQLIVDLSNNSCSCLAVKVGEYMTSIPEELKVIADEYNFPLLEVPPNVYYIDIIMLVMNLIFEDRDSNSIVKKFVKDIIFDIYDNEEMMVEKGKLLGINFDEDYFNTITVDFSESYKESKEKLNKAIDEAKKIVKHICSNASDIDYMPYIQMDKSISVIFYSSSCSKIKKYFELVKKEYLDKEDKEKNEENLYIGIGSLDSNIKGIKKSYFNSIETIKCGKIFKENHMIFDYTDTEIYCILKDSISECAEKLRDLVWTKIKNEEIINTLVKYYQCDKNLEETAKKLFVHKNTIKYRLKKVKELTGLDVKVQEDNFKLYLSIIAEKILLHKTKTT